VSCRSSDGHILVASSSDGYCTVVGFDDDEIGTTLPSHDIPVGARKMEVVNMENSPPSKPVPVITSVNQTTTPQKNITPLTTTTQVNDSSSDKKAGPRRVQLITLSTTPATINSTSAAINNSNSVATNNLSATVNSSNITGTASSVDTTVTTPDIVIL